MIDWLSDFLESLAAACVVVLLIAAQIGIELC